MFSDERQEVLVIKLDDIATYHALLFFYLYFVDDAFVKGWLKVVYLLEGGNDFVEFYAGPVGPENQIEGAQDDLKQVVSLYEFWCLQDDIFDGPADERLDLLAVLQSKELRHQLGHVVLDMLDNSFEEIGHICVFFARVPAEVSMVDL